MAVRWADDSFPNHSTRCITKRIGTDRGRAKASTAAVANHCRHTECPPECTTVAITFARMNLSPVMNPTLPACGSTPQPLRDIERCNRRTGISCAKGPADHSGKLPCSERAAHHGRAIAVLLPIRCGRTPVRRRDEEWCKVPPGRLPATGLHERRARPDCSMCRCAVAISLPSPPQHPENNRPACVRNRPGNSGRVAVFAPVAVGSRAETKRVNRAISRVTDCCASLYGTTGPPRLLLRNARHAVC